MASSSMGQGRGRSGTGRKGEQGGSCPMLSCAGHVPPGQGCEAVDKPLRWPLHAGSCLWPQRGQRLELPSWP